MLSIIATLQTLGFTVKNRLQREETGATAVEYALMVGLIAVVLIAGVTILGDDLSAFFENLSTDLNITGETTTTNS